MPDQTNGPATGGASTSVPVARRVVIEQDANGVMRLTGPDPATTVFMLVIGLYGKLVELTTPPAERPRIIQPGLPESP